MKALQFGFVFNPGKETMLNSRCMASTAPSQTVIYPLTSVDWVWISGGMAKMERAEGRGGMKDYIKKKQHLTVTG